MVDLGHCIKNADNGRVREKPSEIVTEKLAGNLGVMDQKIKKV